MANLAPTSAVADIQWLQKRFQGILDLAEKLENISNLESFSAELAASTQSLKSENAKLVSAKLDAENEVRLAKQEAALILSEAKTKADQLLSEAKTQASNHRETAREAAAAEVQELQTQRVKKQKEIAELTGRATALEGSIAEQQKAYDKLVAMINDLKAKF